ncbi:MAG: GNAT family protein [Nitrososphaerales archaeon]|jgi:RimJ/RimL family protein N-acetyltransferase
MGRRVILRPFGEDDVRHVQKWSNDAELRKLTGGVEPMSNAEAERFYTELRNDKERIWFVIVLKDNDKVIGETGLLRVFRPWRTTDMTVIIGEKDEWGKGYGTEAGRLLLDYAFNRIGLHRVSVGVVGFNKRALRHWKNLGFEKEGVERDGYCCEGEYGDFVMMSILENEYREKRKSV